ncbi:putative porin [Epilithonimonas sp. JDS]|uniref:putative porin n=1 Tax=Epilithonimonas sp. JDS TaxID=2902797 RepID=UPI001E565D81|nr:putative porin [Epilithonimonas sp. JDS]MCD9854147.1 putative porin [Epilithonimonas sp. JDS]
MKYLLLLSFVFSIFINGQQVNKTDSNTLSSDTIKVDSGEKDSMEIYKPTINDYQVKTRFSEKKIYDTTFTIERSYIVTQYNKKDNFGKIQSANIGSGFQNLVYEKNAEQNLNLLPENKSFYIKGENDINYYDVKTPTTTFFYNNAMKNGGQLQTTYTQNVGKNFNFAIEYMGLRSQGLYQNSLASSNNTIFSGHYLSKNGKYEAYAHYIHQNVNNQENGGIADLNVFLNGESQFNNRQNIETNLSGVESRYSARRYYFSQEFSPFDPAKYPFKLRHKIYHQGNKYYLSETTANTAFFDSDDIPNFPLYNKKFTNNLSNTFSLVWDNEKFKLDAGFRHQYLTFGNKNAFPLLNIPGYFKEQRFGAVGNLQIKLLDKIQLKSFLEISKGSEFGNYIKTTNQLVFEPIKDYLVEGRVNFQSAYPSFNYLVNSSHYVDYNYYLENPNNEIVTQLGGTVRLAKWFDTQLFVDFFKIDNYTYFNSSSKPEQSSSSLNISQIGGESTVKYGKFNLNGKVLFQKALNNQDLLPMPDFIGRINLFYQAPAFKKAAEVQVGVKLYYFSKFASREYSPILNEYILPGTNAYSIGGQPIADVYFNMRVKRMFFYIEGQHINQTFMQNKSFTSPYYPIYDFRLNLGVVWYLFH